MLVVDETGDLKKGIHTVGGAAPVQRHRGSGRDAQVAVYLAYAGTGGQAMIDRELYLPQSWTSNADRLDEAGVSEAIEFLTKPALATGMIVCTLKPALQPGAPATRSTAPTRPCTRELETQRIAYVLGIGCDRQISRPRPG